MFAREDAPVRVLVVDDSRLLRRGIRTILEGAGLVVVGECASGVEAVAKVASLRPDVVTLDLDMPGLDGLGTIEHIMAEHPTPIVVVTGDPSYRGLDGHFEALARGAVELVPKPANMVASSEGCMRLVELVRTVSRVAVVPHVRGTARRRRRANTTMPLRPGATPRTGGYAAPSVIAIGASTGGPGALRTLLGGLEDMPVPIIAVQHMAEEFAEGFVRWLQSQVAVPVHEARVGTRMRPGNAYIAVRGPHLRVEADCTISATAGAANPHRPSVDAVFTSLANTCGKRGVGIVLTGMGDDGALGLSEIHAAGGMTIAQDEESSVVFGMPGAAIARNAVRHVLPLDSIAKFTRDTCRADNAFLDRRETP
ncbi:MAG: chemotaxis-specific protein-glutamate methyltransferase CheB [Kofleriaceae bacterium]|nr:chemotaxis-specific protein-glutamate methyltransferase CheB [Kofleriaceae bacterium]